MPVAAAAFFATRLSFDPVFRSALFADFFAFFDKDSDFLRFFMHSSYPLGSFSLAHFSVRWKRPYARQSFLRSGWRQSARSGRAESRSASTGDVLNRHRRHTKLLAITLMPGRPETARALGMACPSSGFSAEVFGRGFARDHANLTAAGFQEYARAYS